jgi:hypothetical protein
MCSTEVDIVMTPKKIQRLGYEVCVYTAAELLSIGRQDCASNVKTG